MCIFIKAIPDIYLFRLLPSNNLFWEGMNFECVKNVTKFPKGILILSRQWDRLSGLVVSLVRRTIEELLEWKSSGSGLENRD
jgi:hypothetical protein